LTLTLFFQYALTPHDLLLRGREEQVSKRLDTIRTLYEDLEFAPVSEREFQKRLGEWRQRATQAELASIRKEPGATAMINSVWQEDHFLNELLHNPEEPERFPKKFLSILLLSAAKDVLAPEVHYRLALSWQEKAERRQAAWEHARTSGNPGILEKKAAQAAWINTRDWWRKYTERHTLAPAAIKARLAPIHHAWRVGDSDVLALWDHFLLDIRRAAVARLYLARAIEHSDRPQDAVGVLNTVLGELTDLEKNPDLKKALADLSQARTPPSRLQAISRELGPAGSLFWLRQTIQRRLQRMGG
jgi:hypothetical protein